MSTEYRVTTDGNEFTSNAPHQARRGSDVALNAVVRQCGNCISGIDLKDRYDQVMCNNPKSSNYDGNTEATDVCEHWQTKGE